MEAGGSLKVLSQPKLHGEFKASLDYIGRPCFKNKTGIINNNNNKKEDMKLGEREGGGTSRSWKKVMVYGYDQNTLLYMHIFFIEYIKVLFKNDPAAGDRAQLTKYLLDKHEDLNFAHGIYVKKK